MVAPLGSKNGKRGQHPNQFPVLCLGIIALNASRPAIVSLISRVWPSPRRSIQPFATSFFRSPSPTWTPSLSTDRHSSDREQPLHDPSMVGPRKNGGHFFLFSPSSTSDGSPRATRFVGACFDHVTTGKR